MAVRISGPNVDEILPVKKLGDLCVWTRVESDLSPQAGLLCRKAQQSQASFELWRFRQRNEKASFRSRRMRHRSRKPPFSGSVQAIPSFSCPIIESDP